MKQQIKRLRNISPRVKARIVHAYREKDEFGNFRYKLKEIAEMYEVSLSTVNNIAKIAHCQSRPQGAQGNRVPTARDMKVCRDATLPGISYEEVGQLNPRPHIDPATGRRIMKPLSRQRVHQIISRWSKYVKQTRKKGFKKGDKIEWDGEVFTVLRYDDAKQGAVQRADGEIWDPFFWNWKHRRAVPMVDVPVGEKPDA